MTLIRVDIEKTLQLLLAQEDTDGDKKITVEDQGPKKFVISSESGSYTVQGTYPLSNLLQELVIAKNEGKTELEIDPSKIEELPVQRISRMIHNYYWKGLTRSMDAHGIEALLADTKNKTIENEVLTVYVPFGDTLAVKYYTELQRQLPLQVVRLPQNITPAYVKSLNANSGILSLKLSEKNGAIRGEPFVVPGGRFNEMYGWDSYFEAVGLLLDGRVDLALGMANNFQYQIQHYGKILNANRSYYLTRTQPPFYSSMISEVFEHTQDKKWLKSHLETAILEYETVWMVMGKRLTSNGLNRYLAEGIGMPPEAEEGHFHHEIEMHAKKAGMPLEDYEMRYAQGTLENLALDDYFVHDRTVRESGHDTSYRLEGICADLNLVELNAMLYKYETDFASLIETHFDDSFKIDTQIYTSQYWTDKAMERKARMDQYLWNKAQGMYFDYNIEKEMPHVFYSATGLMPLWAQMCSQEQAKQLVENLLPKLKEAGGVASCDRDSRGEISAGRPQKQWDYPNGWAPHQMMIWRGLQNYGFHEEQQELIYRWLYMITRNAVDYNGTIPEKYDVVSATHKVFAEYGNVGTEFEYITTEGFGWMNASFQYGVSLLDEAYLHKLNDLVPPKELFPH
ncbi:alpha,alpha-trehalase [Aureisphaera galaxeae]|uniref:alpha,alpha-trehalase n=1 Tax=Aureisphaera galaxeae TaxID=1538023 RepID=UPI0023506F37|nr:alpha,alpha-trehalase [Aureisphaera galaxeae]MDC8002992.1 alpha,alpha-trehalase [Aureisphaera galaxeae]